MRVEGEAEEGVEEPFPEAWVLDTHSWEWLRVAGEVEGAAAAPPVPPAAEGGSSAASAAPPAAAALEALKRAAGRAGHACVLLHDARHLLKHAASAAVACPGAAEALADGGGSAPLPALLLHGGLKADGTRHGDCALLTLPQVLCGQVAAPRGAALQISVSQDDDIPLGQQ